MSDIYRRALEALKNAGVDVDTPFAKTADALKNVPERVRDVSLAALFGAKAAHDFGAFWFAQREIATGAALGFPYALLVVDPLPLVRDSLDRIDAAYAQLRASLQPPSPGERKLDARAYTDLFDPSFVVFVNVDDKRVDAALRMTANDALDKAHNAIANADVDVATKERAQQIVVAPLLKLEPSKTLAEQTKQHGRVVETFIALASTTSSTVPADEGFWADIAFRLLPKSTSNASTSLLGAFDPQSARAVVPDLAVPARLLHIDAGDVATRIAHVDRVARADLEAAYQRLDELRALTPNRLALRRMTAQNVVDEAGIALVLTRLQR